LVAVFPIVRPEGVEVVLARVAWDLQPALLLDEGDEHEAVEEALGEEALAVRIADAANQAFDLLEYGVVLFEEFRGDRLDIESFVVAALDGEGRKSGEGGADGGEVKLGDDLGCRAEFFGGADGEAAEELALALVFGVLDIEEVPVGLAPIGEQEQRVGTVFQEPGDDLALAGQRKAVLRQAGVDDAEIVIGSAGREEDGVAVEQIPRAVRPSSGADGLVRPGVVQATPEQLFQRLGAREVFEQPEDLGLKFELVRWQAALLREFRNMRSSILLAH
jgi:hypothetical protein